MNFSKVKEMSTKLNAAVDAGGGRSTDGTPATRPTRAASDVVPRRRGAEFFDSILWRLRNRMEQDSDTGFFVGLTGCGRRSGVSTVAANVAIRAADHGLGPVLLVDANFQHPRLRRLMGNRKGAGLVEVLTGRASPSEATQPTKVNGLHLLTIGGLEVLERSPIEPDRLEALTKELRHEYRLVVFDLPVATDLHHGLLFASQLDAALLVVRAERVRQQMVEAALSRLLADGVNLVGTIVTGQKRYTPSWIARWL
jgi:Mrp family chromosome partitioning ATPase